MHFSKKVLLFSFLTFGIFQHLNAQTSDDLFSAARKKAFDEKNYPSAIVLAKTALEKSPDYTEIRVFLGRLYTWSNKTDSARAEFATVIAKQPTYDDAFVAYGNLEFWENNTKKALEITNEGLKYTPQSESLKLLKAKLLTDLKEWKNAELIINDVVKNNPKQTEARALATRIRENSAANKFGINYDYIYFDKQFKDPWHLLSADYGRQTNIGPITGRLNYANRFNGNGIQFEVDAYPRLSNTFQAYVNIGYSPDLGIFPRYRAGFSLYANLNSGFELEGGFRLLHFSENTWLYTASLGKYYKNFWFNIRTYISSPTNAISQSFSLNARYYFGGADDYFSFGLSSGLSPDEQRNNVLVRATTYKLKSNGLSLGYRKSFKTFNILSIKASLENQEYLTDTKGNQLGLGIGYLRRF
ncbi:YaiO family outer membrane beta-barrel protein [Pedobacter sp. Du54]|uniref:YaiO family outer membrane beta-barrel protein n=1 Tax=Pedobacter anseongensis TaxID=3133439 RepID=UPI00309FEF84